MPAAHGSTALTMLECLSLQVKRLFLTSDAKVKAVSSRVSHLAAHEAKEDKRLLGEAAAAEKAATERERITVSVSGTRDEKLRVEPAPAEHAAQVVEAAKVPALRSAAHSALVAASASLSTSTASHPTIDVPVKPAHAVEPVAKRVAVAASAAAAPVAAAVVVAAQPAATPGAAAASKVSLLAPAQSTAQAEPAAPEPLEKPRVEKEAKVTEDKKEAEVKEAVKNKAVKTPCLVHMSKFVEDFTPDSPEEC